MMSRWSVHENEAISLREKEVNLSDREMAAILDFLSPRQKLKSGSSLIVNRNYHTIFIHLSYHFFEFILCWILS